MLEKIPWNTLAKRMRSALVSRSAELVERRDALRVPCNVPVLARLDGQDYPCDLVDLSHDGLRVRCPVPLREGNVLLISTRPESGLVGRQRLRCQVVWARKSTFGTEAGLKIADSADNLGVSWLQAALRRFSPSPGRRQARRLPAGLFVDVRDQSGDPLTQGVCLDLGTGGALLRLDRALVVGDVIRVGLGAGNKEANIILVSRVVTSQDDPETGDFLVGVRFFPGASRDHQRLKSLLVTLLDEPRPDR